MSSILETVQRKYAVKCNYRNTYGYGDEYGKYLHLVEVMGPNDTFVMYVSKIGEDMSGSNIRTLFHGSTNHSVYQWVVVPKLYRCELTNMVLDKSFELLGSV